MFRPLQRQLCEAVKYNGRPHPERGGAVHDRFCGRPCFRFGTGRPSVYGGPDASRSLCRRVFAGAFPEPGRAVAGKSGTRGRPNFHKKKASVDLLSSDASRIGLARCPISYSVSRNRVPRRFLRWQDALVPMLRSVSLAILSSGVFCKRHFDRLCRMGFARGAMVSALQRVFRKRMPRHRRYRLPRTVLFGKRVPFPIFSRKAF